MYQSSTPKAEPRAEAIGVRRELTESEVAAIARRMRSTTAVACGTKRLLTKDVVRVCDLPPNSSKTVKLALHP